MILQFIKRHHAIAVGKPAIVGDCVKGVDASYAMGYGMLRSDGSPPEIDPELFEKTGITKEDFDKWAPEIRDDIAFTFEALGGA